MTLFTLARRSLRFHARSHLGAVAGAAVAAAVLIGALLVGDSVRESLKAMGLARLAGAQFAIASGDRFFQEDLLSRMAAQVHPGSSAGSSNLAGAVALVLEGVASSQNGAARANRVQILGIQDDFPFAPAVPAPGPGEAWLNEALARQLGVKPGDEIILRVRKPSALSRDTIITPRSDSSFALRLKVSALAPPGVGGFQLAASQVPPFNAFVARSVLQKAAGLERRANVLLVRDGTSPGNRAPTFGLSELNDALVGAWRPADAELELRPLPLGTLQLSSRRIFLDPAVAEAVLAQGPTNAFRVLTYLVNQIRHGERATPYSMVTATDGPQVPADLGADEVVVNQWLAEDLGLRPGDALDIAYYVLDSVRSLTERTNRFRVRSVVPVAGQYADRTLMPEFPGLAKAESTHDWDAGFELVHEIRDKDDAYWKQHRGTPKAFISLKAGQELWANRFGDLTAIRFNLPPAGDASGSGPLAAPGEGGPLAQLQARVEAALRERVAPASVGLQLQPVRAQALKAATSGQDFGQLFIGFSFFLVAAALLLMSLLFQFSIERRTAEVGTLLALGFPPKRVRRLLLLEGGGLALIGSLLGLAGAVVYARAMVHGLTTIWREAVGTSSLAFHATPATVIGGLIGGWVVAWLTMGWALRRQARQPARQLLAEGAGLDDASGAPGRGRSWGAWMAPGSAVGALVLTVLAFQRQDAGAAGLFFGAGALLLVAGMGFGSRVLQRLSSAGIKQAQSSKFKAQKTVGVLSLVSLGFRNLARRRRRSLAIVALLSCGSFLVTSLGVFRLEAVRNADQRSSGTGGFALIGESTLPLTQDLTTQRGRDFFGLEEGSLQDVAAVAFRVRDGDDASCLNLNRAQRPRVLGVDPTLLATRGAFTFTKAAAGLGVQRGWELLRSTSMQDTNLVPAIGDASSIQWALGKKVGDTVDYVDEAGRPFKLWLVGAVANSILQGNLVIDEAAFTRRFPGVSGHRMLLIDAPSERVAMVSSNLTRALSDFGLELTPAARRLDAFNAVQNTYLGTFQILGGLGLLLGSVGLGVVVLRHVLERRGELALLLAVGFRGSALSRLVLSEHTALLLAGLGLGVAAALLAVLPAAFAPGGQRPGLSLFLTLLAVLLNGLLWTWVATRAALRGRLLDALRNE